MIELITQFIKAIILAMEIHKLNYQSMSADQKATYSTIVIEDMKFWHSIGQAIIKAFSKLEDQKFRSGTNEVPQVMRTDLK